MSAKLIVKNFGPLKDVEIELKGINVFIGETASGKSVLSKLAAIFIDNKLLRNVSKENFVALLKYYDIDIYLKYNPYIRFSNFDFFIEYDNHVLKTNLPFKITKSFQNSYNNIVDYLNEWQGYLYDVICSDKQVYVSIGHREDAILGFLDNLLENTNAYSKEIEKLKKGIEDLKFDKKGVFDTKKELTLAFELYSLLTKIGFSINEIVYIPAERAYISTLSKSLFSIIKNDIALPKCLTDFGAHFEIARNDLKNYLLKILDVEYRFKDNQNIINLPNYQQELQLHQVSSGMQAIIPMLLVLENFRSKFSLVRRCYVIEEPELNLFPDMQKELIEQLIEIYSDYKIKSKNSLVIKQSTLDKIVTNYINSNDRLIITTHSPYNLTSLDNLIQAHNASVKKPEARERISKIVPEKKWVNLNDMAAYYLKDGKATNIMDYEMESIGANKIDDISEQISTTYDKLLNIIFDDE